MFTIFHGSDRQEILRELEKDIATVVVEGFSPVRLSLFDYDEDYVVAELLGEDLFASKKVFILTDVLTSATVQTCLLDWDTSSAETKRIICIEESIPASLRKKFQSKKFEIVEFNAPKAKDDAIFKLTDAFTQRDMKKMWLTYQDFYQNGVSVHQMVGILWWQMKTMLLVSRSGNLNPGLKPFVFNKTKQALVRFTPKELQEKAGELLAVYHRGHMGDDIEVLFERFILNLV